MPVISRHVLLNFIRVFLMTFTCLLGMSILGDMVGHFSELAEYQKTHDNLGWLLWTYYSARVPWFFDLVGRVVCLLAGVFVLGSMQRHNELTALMAAGVPRWRVARPLCIAAAIIAVLGVLNRELAVPRFREILCRDANDLIRGRPRLMTPRYDNRTIFFLGANVVPRDNRIEEPQIRLPLPWGPMGQTLRAKTATFLAETPEHPTGYLLDDVRGPEGWNSAPNLLSHDLPMVLGPAQSPWLKPRQCFVVSSLPIEAFQRSKRWEHYSSTRQLIAGVQGGATDLTPDIQVLIHSRFVQPFLDFSLFLVGLPLAFGGQRRALFSSAFKTLLMATVFSATVILSKALGGQGVIPPVWAAWMPLMCFAPLSASWTYWYFK